ncbi:MAG: DUF4132 domain-containing protein [Gemmataceae bacterium]
MDTNQPRETARALLRNYLEQAGSATNYFDFDPKSVEAGRQLLDAQPEVQVWAVVESVERTLHHLDAPDPWLLRPLRSGLLRRKLSFGRPEVDALVAALLGQTGLQRFDVAVGSLARAFETYVADRGLDDDLRDKFSRLAAHLRDSYAAEYRKAGDRIANLLQPASAEGAVSILQWKTDEAWVETLKQALALMDETARGHWTALVLHCNSASASKPSAKWLKQATALLAPIGHDAFAAVAGSIIEQIGKPGKTPPARMTGMGDQTDPTLIHDVHSDQLRGLVWCTSLVNDDKLTHVVGAAADACFHKLAWIGPRSPKIGNACLNALAQKTDLKAIAELSRLKTRVKHASVKKQLGKSLDAVADKVGMSADELEEVAVPSCGLTGVGIMEQRVGDVTVRVEVDERGKASVAYQPAGKKAQGSVPASIKEAHADEIKTLKKDIKEIDKLWPAQRNRVEQLFLRQADWSLADFRARYLDHGLVGTLARRLIWRFAERAGCWHAGQIVDAEDRPLEGLGDNTRVTVWHPSTAAAAEVEAWRNWLERHEITQPFKQAHREIYLLTEAERATQVYSNRFAAHILRQHQFAALCQQRGWQYRLQGAWDSANTPTLLLPRWDLRVEFWVEAIMDDQDVSAMQVYLHLTTDQVRFLRAESEQP